MYSIINYIKKKTAKKRITLHKIKTSPIIPKQSHLSPTELYMQNKELVRANKLLNESKIRAEQSLKDIMSLYEIVEAFTNQCNINEFLNIFSQYGAKLTNSKISFLWMAPHNLITSQIAINNIGYLNLRFVEDVKKIWEEKITFLKPELVNLDHRDFLVLLVKSQSKKFGLIGISLDIENRTDTMEDYFQKLNFLAKLSGIILQRINCEKVNEKLILYEEQNRIANEIHDSVCQRVFGISCATFSLKTRWTTMNESEIQEQLQLLHESSSNAIKELRATIFKLSNKKNGNKYFETCLREYLQEFSMLNKISIDLFVHGNLELIPSEVKKSIKRIIYEASGNAAKHGKCTNLDIDINIYDKAINLQIIDNGIGFDKKRINFTNTGLGLFNINNMVKAFNGTLEIESGSKEGTKLLINIPA